MAYVPPAAALAGAVPRCYVDYWDDGDAWVKHLRSSVPEHLRDRLIFRSQAAERGVVVGPGSAWATLACPRGSAQLILDCTIDVLDGGDPGVGGGNLDHQVGLVDPLPDVADHGLGALGVVGQRGQHLHRDAPVDVV